MTEDEDANPRAAIGGNFPPIPALVSAVEGDFASIVTEWLDDVYRKQPEIVAALLEECAKLVKDPENRLRPIADDETKAKVASLIKRLRDQAKALAAWHEKEKQPYLRGGQGVDQFFFGLIDKLARRSRTNNPGAADVLQGLLTDYDTRRLAEEQERRRREAEAAARAAEEARRREEAAAREAEEARLAAARARKPETIAAKGEVAETKADAASAASVDATVAEERAEGAHVATLAKPADIMRTRGADGTLSTVKQEPYAEIIDRDALDKAALWPFIAHEAIEKALRAWARSTNYDKPMAGASIGRRNRSVVR